MGSQTAKGYPYPVGTDRVMDGDDAIKALATAVDTISGASASGIVNVVLNNQATAAAAVTFPVGRFTAIPSVVATTSQGNYFGAYFGTTTSGVQIYATQRAGTNATITIPTAWIARQE